MFRARPPQQSQTVGTMESVYAIVHDEGRYSDREWQLLSVWTTLEAARGELLRLTKAHFLAHPNLGYECYFSIHTRSLNVTQEAYNADSDDCEGYQQIDDCPDSEVQAIVKQLRECRARDDAANARRDARKKLYKERESLDDAWRDSRLTMDGYKEAVAAWTARAEAGSYFADAGVS